MSTFVHSCAVADRALRLRVIEGVSVEVETMKTLPLPTIQMFWHGAPLSRIERLSIASFLYHGHSVDLYVYEEPDGVPVGARILDAERVLPRSAVFEHRRTQSLAPFADWFRYKLLFERGGIWADADVVCLRPLDFPSPWIYAWQDDRYINNAVLGLPAGDTMAGWLASCCENPNRVLPYDGLEIRFRKLRRRILRGNRRDAVRWGETGPKGLTRAVGHFGYIRRALPSWHFYPVPLQKHMTLFEAQRDADGVELSGSHAVHLWNQLLKERPGFDKNARFPESSPFERLCACYLAEA